jgi:ketosteroid isomerase-like protein
MNDHDLQASITRLGEAWAQGDLATLETLLSRTYTHTDVFGAFQDRAAWLRYVGARTGRATQIGFRNVETRVVGDVAVVTGINDVSGPGARSAGDQRALSLRFTQVWVRQDGKWLREAFQATPIDDSSHAT